MAVAAVAPGAAVAVAVYPSLGGIKLLDLTAALSNTDNAIAFGQRHGLLAGSQTCQRCPGNVAMVLENTLQVVDGKRWRCPTQGCRSTKSLRQGSFYTHSKLSLADSILVSYSLVIIVKLRYWLKQKLFKKVQQVGLSRNKPGKVSAVLFCDCKRKQNTVVSVTYVIVILLYRRSTAVSH
jgi:hypothetical protein